MSSIPLSQKDLLNFISSPEMDTYQQEKSKRDLKNKGRSSKLPLLALGAIGAGVGARKFGDWVISDGDLSKIQELMAFQNMVDKQTGKANPAWKDSTDFYTQYLDRAGRAAQAKGFGGRSAGDLMVGYRKHIEPMIGGKYPVTDQKAEDAAYEHYNTFASGPMQAFVHHVKSYTENKPEKEREEIMARLLKGFSSSSAKYLGKPEEQITKELADLKTPLNPEEYSFGKQLDTVRNYLASFSSKEDNKDVAWERENLTPLLKSMRAGVASAAKGYGGLEVPLNILHNWPKAIGAGLIGAGAAGLAGWGGMKLYDVITKKNREAEAKRKDLSQRKKLVKLLATTTQNKQASGLSCVLLKLAMDKKETTGSSPVTQPPPSGPLVSVTAPVGMEWDYPEQETRFQNMIKDKRPDLSAHLVRGHGGGTTGGMVVRPRSRLAEDPESQNLNRLNTRSIADVLVAAKNLHKKVPDLLFLGQCNKQYADVKKVVKDSLGNLPSRLVYTTPGAYSNTGVSSQALDYALTERRPILLPKEKEFVNGAASVRALLQPVIPAGASIPAASGALAVVINELIQRKRKQKPTWGRRALVGAGGAALGGLGLLLAREHNRSGGVGSYGPSNFLDTATNAEIPLARPT